MLYVPNRGQVMGWTLGGPQYVHIILYVLFVYLFRILSMKYEALQKAKSANNLRE